MCKEDCVVPLYLCGIQPVTLFIKSIRWEGNGQNSSSPSKEMGVPFPTRRLKEVKEESKGLMGGIKWGSGGKRWPCRERKEKRWTGSTARGEVELVTKQRCSLKNPPLGAHGGKKVVWDLASDSVVLVHWKRRWGWGWWWWWWSLNKGFPDDLSLSLAF